MKRTVIVTWLKTTLMYIALATVWVRLAIGLIGL